MKRKQSAAVDGQTAGLFRAARRPLQGAWPRAADELAVLLDTFERNARHALDAGTQHARHHASALVTAIPELREFVARATPKTRDALLLAAFVGMDGIALQANLEHFTATRAGYGTMNGGRRNAGDHSRLLEWARGRIARGASARGLAAAAVAARVTRLTERQAREVLQRHGLVERRATKRK